MNNVLRVIENKTRSHKRVEFYKSLDFALDSGLVDESEVSRHLCIHYEKLERQSFMSDRK